VHGWKMGCLSLESRWSGSCRWVLWKEGDGTKIRIVLNNTFHLFVNINRRVLNVSGQESSVEIVRPGMKLGTACGESRRVSCLTMVLYQCTKCYQ
jgi:hypothetical protein